jgi:alginate O-acetyltransferase complex protein AlgI
MGWILFYFTDMSQLWKFVQLLFGNSTHPTFRLEFWLVLKENAFWLALALLFTLPIFPAVQKFIAKRPNLDAHPATVWLRTLFMIAVNICLLLISTSLLIGTSFNAFIYGNF